MFFSVLLSFSFVTECHTRCPNPCDGLLDNCMLCFIVAYAAGDTVLTLALCIGGS